VTFQKCNFKEKAEEGEKKNNKNKHKGVLFVKEHRGRRYPLSTRA
jgi:hypothetical protein